MRPAGNLCTITNVVFFLNRHRREIFFITQKTRNQQHNRHATSNTTTDKQQHNRHETTRHDMRRHDTRPAIQHNTEQHMHTTSAITCTCPSAVHVQGLPASFQVVRGLHKKHLDKLFLHVVNISPNREGAKAVIIVIKRET